MDGLLCWCSVALCRRRFFDAGKRNNKKTAKRVVWGKAPGWAVRDQMAVVRKKVLKKNQGGVNSPPVLVMGDAVVVGQRRMELNFKLKLVFTVQLLYTNTQTPNVMYIYLVIYVLL